MTPYPEIVETERNGMSATQPVSTVERIREDRYTFTWPLGDGPIIECGYTPAKMYPARVTHVVARFTPDGELLSTKVTAKKLKKDGTLSTVGAYVPYGYKGLDAGVKAWR